jgi:broad specificity phosphatase PhoE
MRACETPCRVFLVRHGQTVMNREVRFRGRLDIALNERGRAEALEAALSLRDRGLEAVYASPLDRAREVARRIAFAAGVGRIDDLQQLLILDYGAWTGLTKDEAAARDPEEWALYVDDPERARCPGGEAVADAADRVVDGLRLLGERHPGGAVAAVSHGVMLRLAVLRVQGPPASGWQFKVPTGSAIEFAVDAQGIRLVTPVGDAPADPIKAAAVRPAVLRSAV